MIKTITKYICPRCSGSIFVCFGFIPPALSWILPEEEMSQNKLKLKELLENITFKSKTEKEETYTWIDSEDCVLGAEDIEDVAKWIIQEQKGK